MPSPAVPSGVSAVEGELPQAASARPAVAAEAEIISARQMLLQAGAEKVVLSGSGSASFGVFADAESRDKAFLRLAGTLPEGWWIQAADTVNEES